MKGSETTQYSNSSPLFLGDMFQDPQWMPESSDGTKWFGTICMYVYMYTCFLFIFSTHKFNVFSNLTKPLPLDVSIIFVVRSITAKLAFLFHSQVRG